MTENETQNYFAFFGISTAFNIDFNSLETRFRAIQSAMHPDRFVNATKTEQLKAMQKATFANEAYQTLKHPAKRAQYMLQQHGIDAIAETNTAMPMDFLMQQMQWRETIDDAKQAKDLDALEEQAQLLQDEIKTIELSLIRAFDHDNDLNVATDLTRKLIFIDKVRADIHHIIEQIED